MLRAAPGSCKWLVAVAALSSVRVPLPFSVETRRHDDALNYLLVTFFVLLGKK